MPFTNSQNIKNVRLDVKKKKHLFATQQTQFQHLQGISTFPRRKLKRKVQKVGKMEAFVNSWENLRHIYKHPSHIIAVKVTIFKSLAPQWTFSAESWTYTRLESNV